MILLREDVFLLRHTADITRFPSLQILFLKLLPRSPNGPEELLGRRESTLSFEPDDYFPHSFFRQRRELFRLRVPHGCLLLAMLVDSAQAMRHPFTKYVTAARPGGRKRFGGLAPAVRPPVPLSCR